MTIQNLSGIHGKMETDKALRGGLQVNVFIKHEPMPWTPPLSSFLTQSFCCFPWHGCSPTTDLWPASIQHYLPLPTWASLSLNLPSAVFPPFIPCFSMLQWRLSSIFVTWLIDLFADDLLDRGRKRGMMKCCFQELLTDNPKISISAFLKKLSGKHIQFAENTFYKNKYH